MTDGAQGVAGPVAVVLNPAAHAGRAERLWRSVRPGLEWSARTELIHTDPDGAWESDVAAHLSRGTRVFVAAGGDGTVHALVNALVRLHADVPLESIRLGAVGLGSSNDFHKPDPRLLDGIPVRTDLTSTRPRDIGRASLILADSEPEVRHFVVSASAGMVAEANAFFNTPDLIGRRLKRSWTGGAIAYAGVRTILGCPRVTVRLSLDGPTDQVHVLGTLSVLKTPFLSGSFRFDTPAAPDDGLFTVNVAEHAGRAGAIRLMADLSRGRFLGEGRHPGRHHYRVRSCALSFTEPSAVELDGEVRQVREVRFELLGDRILQCQ